VPGSSQVVKSDTVVAVSLVPGPPGMGTLTLTSQLGLSATAELHIQPVVESVDEVAEGTAPVNVTLAVRRPLHIKDAQWKPAGESAIPVTMRSKQDGTYAASITPGAKGTAQLILNEANGYQSVTDVPVA
jgi:hypothetical protein